MMKASENPYLKKYINEVCYPIAYTEVKLGKIIGEDELENLDSDSLYFMTGILNELNLDQIRNNLLLKVLPLKI